MVFPFPPRSSRPVGAAPSQTAMLDAYLQQRAMVTEVIRPVQPGRIAFQGTTWFAFCPYQVEILPNTPVQVVNRYNATTFIVWPVLWANHGLPPIPSSPAAMENAHVSTSHCETAV